MPPAPDLFDKIERTRHDTPRAGETSFTYLNTSARPEGAAVREFLLGCLRRYPAERRDGLVSKLRSIDTNHDAAVFELIVHELLIRSGHKILAIEPAITGRTTSPDFLVQEPGGTDFIVECVVANGKSDAETRAERRLSAALDAIAATASPSHYLSVGVRGRPTAPITGKTLRRGLAKWIGSLPDGEAAKNAAPFVYQEHGLRLRISAMMSRGTPARPRASSIGSTFYGVRSAQPGADLRGPLLKKASKYGDLGKPYIIAINGVGVSSGERELLDALLGSPVAVLSRDAQGVKRGLAATMMVF